MCRTKQAPNPLHLSLAGLLSSLLTSTLLYPLDTLKTLRQLPHPTRTPKNLYRGLVPSLTLSSLCHSLHFPTYHLSLHHLQSHMPTPFPSLLSSLNASLITSVLLVPRDAIKQLLQSQRPLPLHNPLLLYRAYIPTLFRNLPSSALRFLLYDTLKPHLPLPLLAGALSGMASVFLTTPFDVVKTRFATGVIPHQNGMWHAMVRILQTEGTRGLFAGAPHRVIWAGLAAGIGFSSYDACRNWVERTATRTRKAPRLLSSRPRRVRVVAGRRLK